jgi:hypothetical protein
MRRTAREQPWFWRVAQHRGALATDELLDMDGLIGAYGRRGQRRERARHVIERLEVENAKLKRIATEVMREIEALRIS